MALSDILEEFGTRPDQTMVTLSDVSLEERKLASYEAGYQAGWDDSAKANADAGRQVSADFAQNMRDLSMTYHEAYTALLTDLKPLLTQIVEVALPMVAQDTLAPRILEHIEAELRDTPRRAVVIFVAEDEKALLAPMLDQLDDCLSVELRRDDTLMNGQVRVQFGDAVEQQIDTASLISGIKTALQGFFETQAPAPAETAIEREIA